MQTKNEEQLKMIMAARRHYQEHKLVLPDSGIRGQNRLRGRIPLRDELRIPVSNYSVWILTATITLGAVYGVASLLSIIIPHK